jgi:aminoglycoside 2''-phosphotransferase
VPLDRTRLLAQDGPTRQLLLEQIGTVLRELHGLPIDGGEPIPEPVTAPADLRQEYERLSEAVERELLPSMMTWARTWARKLLRPALDGGLDLCYAPAIIHGDLAPYHLCFEDMRETCGPEAGWRQRSGHREVGMDQALKLDHDAGSDPHRFAQHRPGAHESVELAPLTAGVHAGGQRRQQRGVDASAGELARQASGIETHDGRLDTRERRPSEPRTPHCCSATTTELP